MAIDWTRGYSAEWRCWRVDARTWADGEPYGGMLSASVERSSDGQLACGTMECAGEFEPGYYRVAMYAHQDGGAERADMGTFLCESAEGTVEGATRFPTVEMRSVLYPASVCRRLPRAYAPAGSDGAQEAARLLRSCCACPVEVRGGFTLDVDVVYAPGSDALTNAWALVRAGGYMLQVDGRGEVTIAPRPTEPTFSLADAGARVLAGGVGYRLDVSGVPNRYTAVLGAESAEAANDDPDSPVGYPARGYWHDEWDGSPVPVDGETLAAYCARRLREMSTSVAREYTYEREWWPGALPGCVARARSSALGMDGDVRVTAQGYALGGAGAVVKETACEEVGLWQA